MSKILKWVRIGKIPYFPGRYKTWEGNDEPYMLVLDMLTLLPILAVSRDRRAGILDNSVIFKSAGLSVFSNLDFMPIMTPKANVLNNTSNRNYFMKTFEKLKSNRKGAFGEVYKVKHIIENEVYAVKIVKFEGRSFGYPLSLCFLSALWDLTWDSSLSL
ncbi:unnamed protein product [Medioppia subpectinata]|uniref:Protein kinase domain-containing protein n=1 Tax=Medioppia subpectinata TaxID=1979941 RepID=A0A7R9KKN5_9ACAR|nr:unnamed protein product [Medioppia subpectinata]CAG2105210.1 unnamed protein product [Medioppia subpectinata]